MAVGVYDRLGVRPVINARGMNTMASGSLMPQPVLDAIAEAATAFVDMEELNRKAGEHIARLVGVEAAHVTSGSAGGLLLSAAAVITGDDLKAILQLPDTTGLKNGIIIERCRRIRYDQALRTAGAKLVEVGDEDACTPEQLEAAIDDTTAAIMHIVSPYLGNDGVPVETAIEIAHKHGLPCIVDGASTLPTGQPPDKVDRDGRRSGHLQRRQGDSWSAGQRPARRSERFDSSRRAERCPEWRHRPACKVSKEDIIGLVTALELFLAEDWTIEWNRHVEQAQEIVDAVAGMDGVTAIIDTDSETWTTPTILLEVDTKKTGLTPEGLVKALGDGEPPILTRAFQGKLLIDPHNLRGDEASIVARRLREECARIAVPVTA